MLDYEPNWWINVDAVNVVVDEDMQCPVMVAGQAPRWSPIPALTGLEVDVTSLIETNATAN